MARQGKNGTGTQHGKGLLLPIGGAEERSADGPILERFVKEAGGAHARIVVIPTASSDPKAGKRYLELFADIGAHDVALLEVERRADASAPATLELLAGATGIYIAGGDQSRLVSLLAGTLAMETIRARYAAGAIIAGTSAGASILGSHMLVSGNGRETPRKGMVEMVAGFGLLQDVIVDQHFSQRGRIGRLLTLFAANPGLLALGIDEDTGALISPDGSMEIVGSNSVIVMDGRNVVSNFFRQEEGDVVSITDSSLHVLGPGCRFDLVARRAVELCNIPPDELSRPQPEPVAAD